MLHTMIFIALCIIKVVFRKYYLDNFTLCTEIEKLIKNKNYLLPILDIGLLEIDFNCINMCVRVYFLNKVKFILHQRI